MSDELKLQRKLLVTTKPPGTPPEKSGGSPFDAAAPEPANRPETRPGPPMETRFKPGESGNPSGRPKGSGLLSKAYAEALAKQHGRVTGRTVANAVASKVTVMALRGNIQAARELGDRVEGRPNQPLEVSQTPLFSGPEQEAQFDALMQMAVTPELVMRALKASPELLRKVKELLGEEPRLLPPPPPAGGSR